MLSVGHINTCTYIAR